MATTIRNPIEWTAGQVRDATQHLGSVGHALQGDTVAPPVLRRIGMGDIKAALRAGAEDFTHCRSDVAFLCAIYPLIGACIAWMAFDYTLLPLLFPAASGFALLGPVAAIGLYELSRRREAGQPVGWSHAFGLISSPSFGAIFVLGMLLTAVFIAWMVMAFILFQVTLGPEAPVSLGSFISQVLFTPAGWAMAIMGFGIGFMFAVFVLSISVISFPLLLDRPVGLRVAVETSIRLTRENPATVLTWGAIVAGTLALGTVPLFLGLIFVMPVLGHATWHLYRRAVVTGNED